MFTTIRTRFLARAAGALVGSVFVTGLVALLFMWLAIDGLNRYGGVLFMFAPVLMGITGSVLFARWNGSITLGQSLGVTLVSLLFSAVVLLITAKEGLICLAVVTPLALLGTAIGALIAVSWTKGGAKPVPPGSGLLLLIFPLAAWGEAKLDLAAPASTVTTSIVLPATPAEIWPHLQNFTVEAPPDFIGFRAGIAYPLATRTSGAGVDALRECLLSTGPMPERISGWEPPRFLAFVVLATPDPMFEWSPYARIHPPHLHQTLVFKRGEFRLEALANGTTRVSGTTFYPQRLWPGWYWLTYSDAVVRAVHQRVYEQIRVDLAMDRARQNLVQR